MCSELELYKPVTRPTEKTFVFLKGKEILMSENRGLSIWLKHGDRRIDTIIKGLCNNNLNIVAYSPTDLCDVKEFHKGIWYHLPLLNPINTFHGEVYRQFSFSYMPFPVRKLKEFEIDEFRKTLKLQ